MASHANDTAPTVPESKGSPAPDSHPVPRRDWTDASRAEERELLSQALDEAKGRADHDEVRRLHARLRLLDEA